MSRRDTHGPDLDAFQARLLDDLMPLARERAARSGAAPVPAPARRRRSRRRVAAVAAVALVAGAGVASSVVMTWPRADQAAAVGIGCVDAVSAEPDATTIVAADGRAPVEICADLWRDGVVSARASGAVPPLTACLTDAGAVIVYPTADRDVCERFGSTADLPADYERVATQMARFRRALDARLSAGGACRAAEQGAAIARAELRRAGIRGWTVDISPGAGGCVSFGLDGPTRSVIIV